MDPDWAALPKHILDSVVERLVLLSDYLRFSVCMPWYNVAKDHESRRQAIMPKCPMLLISTDKEDTWNVYNVTDNKFLDFQVRLPNKRFCGSSKRWLINIDVNFVITLINPFFRVKGERQDSIICLPPLTPPDRDEARDCYIKVRSTCDVLLCYESKIQTIALLWSCMRGSVGWPSLELAKTQRGHILMKDILSQFKKLFMLKINFML